jgi:cytochrome c peroxidase
MSEAAQRGMDIFNGKGHCTLCHSGPAFSDQSFRNIGVGMDKEKPDVGRSAVTKDERDWGRFKTPGLRNVAKTPPYLHDGSEATLMDVVNYYNRGGIPNRNLDPAMLPLHLTAAEKEDLVAFLEALTGDFPVMGPPSFPENAPSVPGTEGGSR